jgi:hypothetical protein
MKGTPDTPPRGWLNHTVWGLALTSFFSDLGHEAQSTLLPTFLAALGCPPLALGAIEGVTDAASSVMKLGAGWISDRLRPGNQGPVEHTPLKAQSEAT